MDTVSRLSVRPAFGCAVFSSVNALPSTASANGRPSLFGCFIGTYPVVRFLASVRVGRAAIAFSHRSAAFATDAERGLPVLVRKGSGRAWGLATAPGPAQTRDGVCVGVAFRIRALRRRPKRFLSRLNTQPARASVNASPASSWTPTHDSRSGWIATPFLCGSFIRSFPPVYPGARSVPERPPTRVGWGASRGVLLTKHRA